MFTKEWIEKNYCLFLTCIPYKLYLLKLEAVELEAVELEAVELEALELEAVELEVVELEAVELEAVELEAVELEAVECFPTTFRSKLIQKKISREYKLMGGYTHLNNS